MPNLSLWSNCLTEGVYGNLKAKFESYTCRSAFHLVFIVFILKMYISSISFNRKLRRCPALPFEPLHSHLFWQTMFLCTHLRTSWKRLSSHKKQGVMYEIIQWTSFYQTSATEMYKQLTLKSCVIPHSRVKYLSAVCHGGVRAAVIVCEEGC